MMDPIDRIYAQTLKERALYIVQNYGLSVEITESLTTESHTISVGRSEWFFQDPKEAWLFVSGVETGLEEKEKEGTE